MASYFSKSTYWLSSGPQKAQGRVEIGAVWQFESGL